MTVTNTKYKDLVVSNGVTLEFPFTFKTTNSEWVKCYLAVVAGEAPVEVTNFTITLYPDQEVQEGGTVSFAVAPASGTVAIVRVVPSTQELDYTAYGAFPAESHERALDKVTFQQQLTAGEKARFVKYGYVTDFDVPTDVTLEKFAAVGTFLYWKADGSLGAQTLENAGYVNKEYIDLADRVLQLQINGIEVGIPVQVEFEGVSDAVASISTNPANYPNNTGVSTLSYRTKAECDSLVIDFPDGGGSSYVVEVLSSPDGLGDHAAGSKQITIDKTDLSPESYGSNSAMTSSERGAAVAGALSTGFKVSVQFPIDFTVDNAQAVVLLQNIDNLNCNHETSITLPSGEILLDKRVLMSNPTFTKLSITGTDTDSLAITSLSEAGVDRDHSVTLTVADSSAMSVGDYALIFDCQGTGYSRVADGCWKVISKTATTVVVKHTLNASWPAMTVTSGFMWPLKTILRWHADTVGMAVAGTSVKAMSNVVLAGNFNVTTQPPADSAVDGLQIGSSPNTPETGLNESEQMNFGVLYTSRVGVVEWEGNGTQVYGRLYGVLMSTCSNGWRGQQAGRNGSLIVKSSSSSGNGASGYEAEESGFVIATNSVAAGNAQQGFFTIGGGNINCDSSFSIANKTHGLEAKNFSPMLADGITSELNGITGVSTTSGHIIIGGGASIANNGSVDVFAIEGGHVNAKGASSIGVTSIEYSSGSSLIQPIGVYGPPPELIIENVNQGKFRQLLSSTGDLFLSFDPSNTGTYDTPLAMKPDGTLYPLADGTANMGRIGELFDSMFSYNYITKSPDGTAYKLLVPNGGGNATWVPV